MSDPFNNAPPGWIGSYPGNYSGAYSPQLLDHMNNFSAGVTANNAAIFNAGQAQNNQANIDFQTKGPASGYGTVGGYPSFGDPAPVGTYSPGSGLSSYSGTPLSPGGGGGSVFDTGTTPFNTYNNPFDGGGGKASVFDTGTTPYNDYGITGASPTPPANNASQNPYNPYIAFGGADDQDWVRGGSQGARPSTIAGWGGPADQAWYQGGAQGARPSTLYDSKNLFGGIYDQDWVKGGSQGDRPSTVAGWGNVEDQDWVYKHGSQGPRPSTVAGWGGAEDQDWYQHGSEGLRPSVMGEIGRGITDFSSQNRNIWGAGTSPFDDYGQLYDDTTAGGSPTGNYDAFKNTTYRDPWIAAIPEKFRTNEAVDAMKTLAQQRGWDPAALASVIQMETQNSRVAGKSGITPESLWNTLTETGQYHGLTQMGQGTFSDAGGTLNGLTYDQYKRATPAQQIATYGSWLDQGAKIPGSAAGLIAGGIGNLPPEMQAAIMMGTQFGPNAKSWVSALGEGNMDVRTTPSPQAAELKPWTINAMRDAMAAQMAKWPQTQPPWPLP